MNILYTIMGNPISKKNSMKMCLNRKTLKIFPRPSAAYEKYEAMAKGSLKPLAPKEPINVPVTVTCTYYMGTKRKVDLNNMLEATDDILVRAGILEDDNCTIVVSHDGSRVFYDKNFPRVEIQITNYTGDMFPND